MCAAYLACGAIFALLFLWRWVGRLDPLAAHGTIAFRVLVFPGVTALWPLFAVRLARGESAPPDEWTAHAPRRECMPDVLVERAPMIRPLRRAHRLACALLAIVIPALLMAALLARRG